MKKKYIVTIRENYYAYVDHTVEANDEQEADDIASELHAEHETPVEEIQFDEWEIVTTKEDKS